MEILGGLQNAWLTSNIAWCTHVTTQGIKREDTSIISVFTTPHVFLFKIRIVTVGIGIITLGAYVPFFVNNFGDFLSVLSDNLGNTSK